MGLKQFKLWMVPTMVGSIVLGGVLTHALLHSICDLKAAQINVQCSLIQEFLLYEFELGHNAVKAIKNICCAKVEGAVNHTTVTRWFKKFCFDCKNLDYQASPRPRILRP